VALRLSLSEPGTGGSPIPETEDLVALMRRGNAGAWPNWRRAPIANETIESAWARALAERGRPGSPQTLHVYTHFAYCEMSCKFCMYYHRVPKETELLEAYADYLVRALVERRRNVGMVHATHAYCGGGTPSALPLTALERFFTAFSESVRVLGDFTFEAHPITLDEDKLRLARRHGVNRVSMGIQSLEPEVLRLVARKNPPLERIRQLTRSAQAQGILVNLDLMQGLPQQTPESLRADIARLLEIAPDTITVYRFQPVARLAGRPSVDMTFGHVFDAKTRISVLRRGFLPAVPRSDQAYGAKLWALSRRSIRTWAGQLVSGVRRVRDAGAAAGEYSCFSAPRSHVMGFGPGAFSHIYGQYWFYDCTSLDGVHSGAGVEARGTCLDVEDEWRGMWLASLERGELIDPTLARELDAVDVPALCQSLRNEPGLEWRGGRFRFRRNASDAQRNRVTTSLMPAPHALELEPVAMPETGRVDELCALVGIGNIGSKLEDSGWQVLARSARRIEFRSSDQRHRLGLVVESADAMPESYRVAGGISVRYIGDELTSTQREFLDLLCARLESSTGG
jgi:hypothetical protein